MLWLKNYQKLNLFFPNTSFHEKSQKLNFHYEFSEGIPTTVHRLCAAPRRTAVLGYTCSFSTAKTAKQLFLCGGLERRAPAVPTVLPDQTGNSSYSGTVTGN